MSCGDSGMPRLFRWPTATSNEDNRPRKAGPPHGGPAVQFVCAFAANAQSQPVLALLRGNYAERSGEVIVGTGAKEKLIGGAVLSCAVTKFEGPELIDADDDAIRIL
jgi:hypothetical protein